MHEAYTLRGSLRECRMNGPAPAAPVPAAAGILVTAPAPEQPGQPEQFLVTPSHRSKFRMKGTCMMSHCSQQKTH